MLFARSIATITLLIPFALSAVIPPPAASTTYIVKIKDTSNVTKATRSQWVQNTLARGGASTLNVLQSGNKFGWEEDVFNGFTMQLDPSQIDVLKANDNIEFIQEEGTVEALGFVTQTNAPWGIARIASPTALLNRDVDSLNNTYTFDDSAGEGVDIYIVDTGVRITHSEFGSRASSGGAFGGIEDEGDRSGHGTHCAGSAAGATFGIAKKANIISVKVLGDNGKGGNIGVIDGINFVVKEARRTGRPTVMSMSLGGGRDEAMDIAVRNTVRAGVHAVVAAGNNGFDAEARSPAREASAITVGATNIKDEIASFSNFGRLVDIYAPGEQILSAGILSDIEATLKSGTSMATPQVAGLVAYILGLEGQKSPAEMRARLLTLSQRNRIDFSREAAVDSSNILASNGAPAFAAAFLEQ